MSGDPFHEVRAEVEAALRELSATSSSYARRARATPRAQHASDSELQQTIAQLRAQLLAIEPDVEELEDAIAAIEEPGVARRLGIADSEVKLRRSVVQRIKGELYDPTRRRPSTSSSAYPPSYRTTGSTQPEEEPRNEPDSNAEFEMQHQSLLIEQQDRTLTDISGTVGLLREQAHLMGQEVFEQNRMLDEIDEHVDSTSSRLAKAQNRMDRFVREHNSGSNWCIFILMILLAILLFVILFM
ncbi:hypothetical protein JCM10908_007293 [Rhodotorula pacifica]|uniref:uncharacterized protein n=1 Tax=Rhodotorula pacifica TaxID=1495444 RepID=UPI0031785CC2